VKRKGKRKHTNIEGDSKCVFELFHTTLDDFFQFIESVEFVLVDLGKEYVIHTQPHGSNRHNHMGPTETHKHKYTHIENPSARSSLVRSVGST
jgi:hypothetical protein